MVTFQFALFFILSSVAPAQHIEVKSSCNDITEDGLYYIKPTEYGNVIPVICSRGYTMIDLSLDQSMESFSVYLESWNVETSNGRMKPYFSDDDRFHELWLLTDQFTKFRIAPKCTSCEMTGVHPRRVVGMDYCHCYKPLQSPSTFTVDASELPVVTLSDFSPDELYIDHHIVVKPGRKKMKKQRHLNVMQQDGPTEVHLDNDLKSTPHIRIRDIFETNWIAAVFWSIMVILCVLLAAFGYAKCDSSRPTESNSESSSMPGSAYWIRI